MLKMNRYKDLKEKKVLKRIPIGIEIFKERIDTQSYYIDKTQLIFNIRKSGVVYWTLNMNMLYYFFP